MSEPTDDAQPQLSKGEPLSPISADTLPDTEDLEVLAQASEPALLILKPGSIPPTSRKLAPPPKPKRDSHPAGPGSNPPPPNEVASVSPVPMVDSLRPPSTPSISFTDASASSRDAIAAALAGSEPLRAIGEALAQNAGAFSASETPTGGRPPVPRPRSQPELNAAAGFSDEVGAAPLSAVAAPAGIRTDGAVPETRPSHDVPTKTPSEPPRSHRDKTITIPDDVAPAPTPQSSSSVFASRIIAVGIHSDRPPPLPAVEPPGEATAESPTTVDESEADTPPPAHVETVPLPDVEPVVPRRVEAERPPAMPAEEPSAPPIEAVVAPPSEAHTERLADEDLGPDSVDRIQVEELSGEDAPSVPPEEPATPPPIPSGRAEAKPPPPPKRPPAPHAVAAEAEQKKKAKQKRAWWEELFNEDFVRANWKVSDEQIRREVTFVEESLGVAAGGVVLDLGCGAGQHAVELASRGYGVVGYDLSLYQLALAADVAQERSQKINFLQGDMREMAFEEMFDGIFCWNTSFGYFEEDKNFAVAERVFRALRPGGMFLVDVINRDFVAAHTPSSVWFEGDSCVCMDDAVIDYFTSRLRVKRSVILDDGRTRECTYSVRLYSFHELGKLLHEVGFRVTEVSGHPATPGVFLGQASPRILMLAQRP